MSEGYIKKYKQTNC